MPELSLVRERQNVARGLTNDELKTIQEIEKHIQRPPENSRRVLSGIEDVATTNNHTPEHENSTHLSHCFSPLP